MKVYFVFSFTDKPSGGVFQFTKALKEYFSKYDCIVENPEEADIFYISAFQFVEKIIQLKLKYSDKLFIHRIDGPIKLYNRRDDIRDDIVNLINYRIADGTIFQSKWSKVNSKKMGIKDKKFETIILNAPNHNNFNRLNKIEFLKSRKIKLIATSWSDNLKKGFEIYKWLDKNLDFSKYEFTFIGNSPIKFKNIIYKKPMNSEMLAKELKQNDIFITASQKDPCSNSLIEALHCGLPAIGLNDGGHTEIIGKSGEVFDNQEEILYILEKIIGSYEDYQNNISLPTLDEVGEKYYKFLETVYIEQKIGAYKVKRFTFIDYINIRKKLLIWKLNEKLKGFKNRIFR